MKSRRPDLRHLAGGDIGHLFRSGLAHLHVSLADVPLIVAAVLIGASPWLVVAAIALFH
jgi:hypothetical protein